MNNELCLIEICFDQCYVSHNLNIHIILQDLHFFKQQVVALVQQFFYPQQKSSSPLLVDDCIIYLHVPNSMVVLLRLDFSVLALAIDIPLWKMRS